MYDRLAALVFVLVLVFGNAGLVTAYAEEGPAESLMNELEVDTLNPEDVGTESALLRGNITDLGGEDSVTSFFRYREKETVDWNETETETHESEGVFEQEVVNLSSGTEYEYKAVAESDGVEEVGDIVNFTTAFQTDPYEWDGFLQPEEGEDIYVDEIPSDIESVIDGVPEDEDTDDFDYWADFYLNDVLVEEEVPMEETPETTEYYYTIEDEGSHHLEVEWHYDLGLIDTDEVNITVEEGEAEFEVSDLVLDPSSVYPDEDFVVSVDVTNVGTVSDIYTAEFYQEEDLIGTDTVEVDVGYTETASITHSVEDTGDHDISVEDLVETVTVQNEPEVETHSVDEVGTSFATLEGEVTEIGLEDYVDGSFRYSEVGSVTWDQTEPLTVGGEGTYDDTVEGLESNTEYEFRAVLEWDGEEDEGDLMSFTTKQEATFEVTYLGVSSTEVYVDDVIDINANVMNHGDVTGDHTVEFFEDGSLIGEDTVTVDSGETEEASITHSFDSAGSYEVSVYDPYNEENLIEEVDVAEYPSVETQNAEDITIDSADLIGYLEEMGHESNFDGYFQYKEVGEDEWIETNKQIVSELGSFTREIDDLEDNSEYKYRALIEWDDNVVTGSNVTFTTDEDANFEITDLNTDVSEVYPDESFVISATVHNHGDVSGEHTVIFYEEDNDIGEDTVYVDSGESEDAELSHGISGPGDYTLSVEDPYSGETVETVIYVSEEPSVQTIGCENKTISSGDLVGEVTEIGLEDDVEVFFRYRKESDSEWSETPLQTVDGEYTFNETIEGLTDNTTYEFKSIMEWEGEKVGDVLTFTTLEDATFEVEELSVSPEEVYINESFNIEATVYNHGDVQGEYTVEYDKEEEYIGENTVEVASGESETAVLTHETGEEGYHTINVTDPMSGSNLSTEVYVSPSPDVFTWDVVDITTHSATLVGSLTEMGLESSITALFEYREEGESEWSEPGSGSIMSSTGTYDDDLTNLAEGVTYEFRALILYDGGSDRGSIMNFTTLEDANFEVSNLTIEDTEIYHSIEETVLSADVHNHGGVSEDYTVTFELDDETLGSETITVEGGETKTAEFDYTPLEDHIGDGTIHVYDPYNEQTLEDDIYVSEHPEVITNMPSNVDTTSAELEGELIDLALEDETTVLFRYRKDGEEEWSETTSETKDEPSFYSYLLDNLQEGQEYEYKAVVTWMDDAENVGEIVSFNTTNLPQVETRDADNIYTDSASLHGELISLGDIEEVEVYFEYRETGGSWITTESQVLTESGEFDEHVDDLVEDTEYEFRATVTWDEDEKREGDALLFKTLSEAEFEIEYINISRDDVYVNEDFTVEASVYNHGDVGRNYTVEFMYDGDVIGEDTVYVGSGESKIANYIHEFEESGLKTIYVYDEMHEETLEDFVEVHNSPSVLTENAEDITVDSATLVGYVEDLGLEDDVIVYFRYREAGTDEWTYTSEQTMTEEGSFYYELEGLDDNTLYEFQALLDYEEQTDEGNIEDFSTLQDATFVIIEVNIVPDEVYLDEIFTIEAVVENTGDVSGEYDVEFYYDSELIGSDMITVEPGDTEIASLDYSINESGDHELYAGDGDMSGVVTIHNYPESSTNDAENITTESATLKGEVTNIGLEEEVDVYFEYRIAGTDEWSQTPAQTITEETMFEYKIEELESDTLYEFRANLIWDGNIEEGNINDFYTEKIPPEVITEGVDDVTESSATLEGAVSDMGDYDAVEGYFEFREYGADEWHEVGFQSLYDDGIFYHDVGVLAPDTLYEFRAIVSYNSTVVGETMQFTTEDIPITIETVGSSDVEIENATLYGNLTDMGTEDEVEVFFYYRVEGEEGWQESVRLVMNETGEYNVSVTDLWANSKYEFKAVGENQTEDEGSIMTFETESVEVPIVDVYPGEGDVVSGEELDIIVVIDHPLDYSLESGKVDLIDGWPPLEASVDGDTAFVEVPIILREREHSYEFYIEDEVGNTNSTEVTFFVKNSAPEIEITEPSDGVEELTYEEEFTIKGYTDAETLIIDGEEVGVDDEEFSFETILVEGLNEFTIVATDEAGNVNEKTCTALYLPQLPEIESSIAELEQDILENYENISGLQSFTEDLEADLTDLEGELDYEVNRLEDALIENMTALEDAIEENRTDLVDMIGENVTYLENRLDDVEGDIDEIYSELKDISSSVGHLENVTESNIASIQELENITDVLDADISNLSDSLIDEIENLETAIDENVSALENAIGDNRSELIYAISENITDVEEDIIQINDELDDIHSNISSLQSSVGALDSLVHNNEEDIKELYNITSDLDFELRDLQNKLLNQIDEVELALEENITKLNSEISAIDGELSDIGLSISHARDNISDLNESVVEIRTNITKIEEDLEDIDALWDEFDEYMSLDEFNNVVKEFVLDDDGSIDVNQTLEMYLVNNGYLTEEEIEEIVYDRVTEEYLRDVLEDVYLTKEEFNEFINESMDDGNLTGSLEDKLSEYMREDEVNESLNDLRATIFDDIEDDLELYTTYAELSDTQEEQSDDIFLSQLLSIGSLLLAGFVLLLFLLQFFNMGGFSKTGNDEEGEEDAGDELIEEDVQMGACPDCDSLIPVDSSECPECGVLLAGPGGGE